MSANSSTADWFNQKVGTEDEVVKTKQSDRQRADIDPGNGIPAGFQFDAEFSVTSIADNGVWSSTRGELTNTWFNPTQNGG